MKQQCEFKGLIPTNIHNNKKFLMNRKSFPTNVQLNNGFLIQMKQEPGKFFLHLNQ